MAGLFSAAMTPSAFSKALVKVATSVPLLPDWAQNVKEGEWNALSSTPALEQSPVTAYMYQGEGFEFNRYDIAYFDPAIDDWVVLSAEPRSIP